MSTKAQGHGGHKPSLRELHQEFQSLQLELENHLDKEERDLFPVIAAMSRGEESSSGLDEPIGGMIHEHEGAGSWRAQAVAARAPSRVPVTAAGARESSR